MKGNILDYNFQESKGIISGTDGKRYTFENSEWRCNTSPIINQLVDFDIDEQNAKNIYLDKTSVNVDEIKNDLNVTKNNKIQNKFGFIVSILLAICLFVSVAKINMGYSDFFIEFSVINTNLGFIALIGTIMSAFLFYSGGKQLLTKISIIIVSVIILLSLKEIYLDAYNYVYTMDTIANKKIENLLKNKDIIKKMGITDIPMNNKSFIDRFTQIVNFGIILLISILILYISSGFKKGYKEIK
ncbi:hypothetical protein N5T80_02845 [Aliarcobacter cryaerophilus]|uniref:hypothetical protein n=2 Tax=Aliarcobacter cryaerophilus TaxID=28198 RepID=UPI0021B6963B|nr:hypothetical protein [Aliarcobacter cryaerophilus]MCT7545251.1 hypothetical protein [Aliarcobacter cryaerophilus]